MAALSEEAKTFIVQRLACFDRPQKIADVVKEEFGVDVSRQQVQVYDPTVGKKPAAKWCALFKSTRRAYLRKTSRIGISHKAYRLDRYQRMFERAEDIGHLQLAKELLEAAAKEQGGAFTNRRELTGKDGGPMKVEGATFEMDLGYRAPPPSTPPESLPPEARAEMARAGVKP